MTLYVVGLGPGAGDSMTPRAKTALEAADTIVGYTVYVELIAEAFPNKELITTPMRSEIERCRMALERASEGEPAGKNVAMVCSGDPGVYGMASLIYELADEYPCVNVEVIPGVTAATAGAALLGAPLTHDFAVISLSDLLTPWETIEQRLELAARADFVLCLYNPSSHKRPDYLRRACDIILRAKPGITACGIARNIGREGESFQVLALNELRDFEADMFTTVFVGNSHTAIQNGRLITPRGYLQRKD